MDLQCIQSAGPGPLFNRCRHRLKEVGQSGKGRARTTPHPVRRLGRKLSESKRGSGKGQEKQAQQALKTSVVVPGRALFYFTSFY